MRRSRLRAAVLPALLASAICWQVACGPAATRPETGAPTPVPSQPAPSPTAPGNPDPGNPRHVTVLVLDMSGSMATNDRDDIRCAAARTFIALSQPGELVGVIGFAGSDASVWEPPTDTTPAGAQRLEQAVTDGCKLGTATPTYRALDEAYRQLDAAPGSGPRSAMLLTDGTPDPGGAAEIGRIESELVPQYQARHWHIDTVGLGTENVDFSFLQRISDATGGSYYDGSQRQRATAYNLLPAFVDVLKTELGRDAGTDDFQESTGTHRFTVALSARRLDVVVVCQRQCPRVTLQGPTGDVVPPLLPISKGPSAPTLGAVFSVPDPVPSNAGQSQREWVVTNPDAGSFRVASLVDVPLSLTVAMTPPFPIGRALAVRADVLEKDGTRYPGLLSLIGALGPDLQFTLGREASGDYLGTVTIPPGARPGRYAVTVKASRTSTDAVLASAETTIDAGLFPEPSQVRLSASATRWPSWITALYSLPGLDRLSGWALDGGAPEPTVALTGSLSDPGGASDTQRPIVTAEAARRPGAPPTASIPAGPAGPGRYWLRLPAAASGDYAVTLHVGGPDSGGATLPAATVVHVTVHDAPAAQVWRAGGATVLLGALLLLLLLCVRFVAMRPPSGGLKEGAEPEPDPLAHPRGPARAFLLRNRQWSRDPEGLTFRFGYLSGIEVRANGRDGDRWLDGDGEKLSRRFRHEHLLFHDGTRYEVVDDEDLSWRHAVPVLARALGLPVPVPRVEDEDQSHDHASFIP